MSGDQKIMDDIIKQQVGAVKVELEKAHIEPQQRDSLITRLAHADACTDGDLKAIGQALAYMLMDSVRSEIRQYDVVKRIVDEQLTSRRPKNLKEFGMHIVDQYPVLAAVGAAYAISKVGWTKVLALLSEFFK